jgi:predicted PurR-regulated permease PerM
MAEVIKLDIPARTIVRLIFWVIALFFLFYIRDILILLFLAVIVASAMDPPVTRLGRWGVPRILATLLIYVVVFGLLAAALMALVPPLIEQLSQLKLAIPAIAERLRALTGGLVASDFNFAEGMQEYIREAIYGLVESAGSLFATTRSVFGGILATIFVFVLSFYLVLEREALTNFLRTVVPTDYHAYVLQVVEHARSKIGRWVGAQLMLGVTVAVLTFIGLTALNIPFALTLSLWAGFLELIPIIGPIIAAVPAVLFGFATSPLLGALTVVLYLAIQQVENHILVPVIIRRAIGLNPLVTIVAVILGAKMAGILGIVMAVPAAAIVAAFVSGTREEMERLA